MMPCATLLRVDAVFAQRLVKRYCHPNCRIACCQSTVAIACVDYILGNTITDRNASKENSSNKQKLYAYEVLWQTRIHTKMKSQVINPNEFSSKTRNEKNVHKLSDDKGTEHTRLLAMQHAVRHLLSNVAVLSSHTPGLDKLLIWIGIPRHPELVSVLSCLWRVRSAL